MDLRLRIIDKHLLEGIIEVTIEKAPLISDIVLNMGPTNQLKDTSKLHLISMKIVAVLVILYCLAYQNNINYFLFLVALYL